MDHRELKTTQGYYRVGEERRREAVDRVTTLQFDRHGNRVWRKPRPCSSPNTSAGPSARSPSPTASAPSRRTSRPAARLPVPVPLRGLDHFRTDVSYLPDLQAYLADLLRSRERLAAFAADEWARGTRPCPPRRRSAASVA